jgi:hypothetical protein
VCPSCRKHLRFAPGGGGGDVVPAFTPLRVEGSIRHQTAGDAWEYAVLISITNERGEEVARQIVSVGAIHPGELRNFTFAVEVFTPSGVAETNVAPRVAERGVLRDQTTSRA